MDNNHDDQKELEMEVPPYFLCPISLEIMKDPVTVSTGITYDRQNIEKWVFSNNNITTACPVTKQGLDYDNDNTFLLTPNHTLRRLIQSWCVLHGFQRFPTPKPPASHSHFLNLIRRASTIRDSLPNCIHILHSLASESTANRRCLASTPGAPEFLARVISNYDEVSSLTTRKEALSILVQLQISDEAVLKNMLAQNEGAFLHSLVWMMQVNTSSSCHAIELMKVLVQVAEPTQLVSLKYEHFAEIVRVIKDTYNAGPPNKATKAALNVLALACPWGRNRIRAVKAGAVQALVDLLVDCSTDKRCSEMALTVLDQLCGCAEGRAELLDHPAGLAVVSKKILRVSHLATEKGVRVLMMVAKFSGTPRVVQEMLMLGVVTKLCLVLQVECEVKTKERAQEILRLHAKAWRNSPCVPALLLASL